MPIETWPYPFAKDNNTLEKLIEDFDYQTSKEKIARHLKEFGSYENGSATQKAVELLEEVRKEN